MRLGYQIGPPDQPDIINPNTVQSESLSPTQIPQGFGQSAMSARRSADQGAAAAEGMTASLTRMYSQAQDDANQVRVTDAMNQARQTSLDLTYNPDSGYLAQKGIAAQPGDDGQTLSQKYNEQLQSKIDDLSAGLGNDKQRQLFTQQSQTLATSFTGEVEKHTLNEWKAYSMEVQNGAVKLGQDDAERNWNDPDKIQADVRSVSAAVVRAGTLAGQPANLTASQLLVATSQIHSKVIAAAIENNNPVYAQQYLAQFKDGMTAADILKVSGSLTRDVDARIADNVVQQARVEAAPATQPSDLTRLKGIVLGLESQGKDFDKDGNPLTSSAGAKYAMQVEPATAKNPGFGIVPAADDSPAEYNRVGGQYLQAMVQKYGNPAQAMAAYNAGPKATDDAIHEATKDKQPEKWLAYLPNETQTYVAKGMKQLNGGGGIPPVPTLQQFVDSAVAKLGDNPTPQQLAFTKTAAEKQYQITKTSNKELADQSLSTVQQTLIANGGDWGAVPASQKDALAANDPARYASIPQFANAIANPSRETDPGVYFNLVSYPDKMAKLTDADFMALRPSLSERDFDTLTRERSRINNASTDDKSGSLAYQALNGAIKTRLESSGVNPTPGPKDGESRAQVGTIMMFVHDAAAKHQQDLGRKMTPVESEQFVDGLFQKNTEFRSVWDGSVGKLLGIAVPTGQMMTMKADAIPADAATQIKSAWIRAGVPKPSDDQMLRSYWTMMSKGNKAKPALPGPQASSGDAGATGGWD